MKHIFYNVTLRLDAYYKEGHRSEMSNETDRAEEIIKRKILEINAELSAQNPYGDNVKLSLKLE